jgi:hypothetical protein
MSTTIIPKHPEEPVYFISVPASEFIVSDISVNSQEKLPTAGVTGKLENFEPPDAIHSTITSCFGKRFLLMPSRYDISHTNAGLCLGHVLSIYITSLSVFLCTKFRFFWPPQWHCALPSITKIIYKTLGSQQKRLFQPWLYYCTGLCLS